MSPEPTLDGIVLLDKPAGGSSHGSVAHMRRILHTRRIGHGGTLDPAATGVLIILVGRATRVVDYLSGGTKVYEATFRFGRSTSTDDAAGEVIEEAEVPGVGIGEFVESKKVFLGTIEQVPPAFSAVHSDGVRAYRKARRGVAMDLPPRAVTVFDIDVLAWNPPDLDVTISCGSGTYIRSIARDWGRELGSAAHVLRLRRTRSGVFDIDACMSFETIESCVAAGNVNEVVRSPIAALQEAIGSTRILDGERRRRFINAAVIPDEGAEGQLSVALAPQEELLGIGKTSRGAFAPVLVYPAA
jgi:tRNA pseudouridine55 synthase